MKVEVKYGDQPDGDKEECTIEVGNFDTVLVIKEKIERHLHIPISKQTLFFKGRVLLNDHHNVAQCKIVNKSTLKLFVSCNRYNPDRNNNQVLHQNQQPRAPSNLTRQITHGHQDPPVMNPRSNNNESSLPLPGPSNSTDELLGIQDLTVGSSRDRNQTEKSPETSALVEAFLSQDWSTTTKNDRSLTVSDMEEFLGIKDDLPPVNFGSSRNRNQTEKSSSSDSVKEIIYIPDSPEKKKIKPMPMPIPSGKMTVFVQLFEETRMIPVVVNSLDIIKVLTTELVTMQQRGELDLPREGYFFVFKKTPLIETSSFFWNGIADGDIIKATRSAVYQKPR
ncbi:hypothetical protein CARUB_v10003014mg [Capsella rubella]|uniref:Ubiquitin-like domain-containing protein n=1 Tax=Capsella rubella TaxID=81985 RepID=R0HF19_9BRAS|nr:hypothetical protein CARUB_v10003014mg [Capsella rubella]